MIETIGIDLENYYDKEISIKPLGIDGYLHHPQAHLYLISLYSEDAEGNPSLEFSSPLDSPDIPWERINGCHAVAHNARFDETDWLINIEKGIIPEDCLPAKWSCTADLSVYLSAPRALLGATKQLLDLTISKAYRGTALGKNWKDFSKQEQEEIRSAGIQDARGSYLLWKHFNAYWPQAEQQLSRINREMGRRGIRINEEELDKAISHMDHTLWEAGKTIPWEWGGKISKTPLSPKNIGLECRKLNIPCPASFAQDSVEAQEWEKTYSEKYPWIKALKIWRTGNGFLSKLNTIKTRIVNEIYPYSLKYCGAHTGRFSGDGGFNMQNIYRAERFGINLRHLFIPRAGKKFLILDFAQIEARILLWVAGMEHALELVRSGLSVYEVHAIETMGWNAANGRLEEKDPGLYSLAKARVLALGYGCGHEKFQFMAKTLCNLDLELPECKRIVDDFRSKNREICRHWQTLHSAMLSTTRKKSREYHLNLASGRALSYFHVTAAEGMKAQPERGGTAYYYYGGKLCVTEETLVLTPRGAVPIIDLTDDDKVWDGDHWVPHHGVIYKGKAEVGTWLGIRITADHKVTDGNSWRKVIDSDEKFTQNALKWAHYSVNSPLFKEELATTQQQALEIVATLNTKYLHGRYTEAKQRVVINKGTLEWKPLTYDVYDLFKCGPNNRYAILTDYGPVVIHNCENEIQALGRDVLRDAMIACNTHASEFPMVLNVHDEIVFEVPEDIDEASIDRLGSLMTDSSPWAKGLPLGVKGDLTDHYKK